MKHVKKSNIYLVSCSSQNNMVGSIECIFVATYGAKDRVWHKFVLLHFRFGHDPCWLITVIKQDTYSSYYCYNVLEGEP